MLYCILFNKGVLQKYNMRLGPVTNIVEIPNLEEIFFETFHGLGDFDMLNLFV